MRKLINYIQSWFYVHDWECIFNVEICDDEHPIKRVKTYRCKK